MFRSPLKSCDSLSLSQLSRATNENRSTTLTESFAPNSVPRPALPRGPFKTLLFSSEMPANARDGFRKNRDQASSLCSEEMVVSTSFID